MILYLSDSASASSNGIRGKPFRKFLDAKEKLKIPTTKASWENATKGTSDLAKAFKKDAEERFTYAREEAKKRLAVMRSSLNEPSWTKEGSAIMKAFFGSASAPMKKLLQENLEEMENFLAGGGLTLGYAEPDGFARIEWAHVVYPASIVDGPPTCRLNYLFMASPDVDGVIFDAKSPFQYWTPGLYAVKGKPNFQTASTPANGESAGENWEIDGSKTFLALPNVQSPKYNSLGSILIHELAHMRSRAKDIKYLAEFDGAFKFSIELEAEPLVAARFAYDISLDDGVLQEVAQHRQQREITRALASSDMDPGPTPDMKWLRVRDLPVFRPIILGFWADYLLSVAKQSAAKQAGSP